MKKLDVDDNVIGHSKADKLVPKFVCDIYTLKVETNTFIKKCKQLKIEI